MNKNIIEQYNITEDGFNAKVNILGSKGSMKTYELVYQQISAATNALLMQVKEDLIETVQVSANEILDPKTINILKERFRQQASKLLKKNLPNLDKKTETFLVMSMMKDMLGLGDLDIILADPNLEEIVVTSSSEPVRVFHKKYGWLITNINPKDETQIRNYTNTIARRVGRQITTLNPLLDAHLVTGDRANAVLYPIASKGNTITIRKFARDPWTVTDLIKNNTADSSIFALIWLAIQYESNILISGGTGSGKTSFLNVCMPFMPPNHRIISIEDTRELMLPEFLYWCPLTTRLSNAEGKGNVSMLDLLINSLRMRPDRIILGEMRKKEQAKVLFEAMHTGHSVCATVHADSVKATIERLTNPPIEVPANLLTAVGLNIVMFRNRQKNLRRLYQIGEFLPGSNGIEQIATPNILYRWNPTTDKIQSHKKPVRFFEELSRHTGMTTKQINSNLKDKKTILDWMVKHNIHSIQSVGKIMYQYYLDPEFVTTAAKSDANPEKILQTKEAQQ